jgi:Leucine-rich repeat (LRR) protein
MLNGNKLVNLDHLPAFECIKEIYLDGNQIASLAEVQKLETLKTLEHLSMGGNPIVEEKGDDFKKEVLILLYDKLPNLKKINGDAFSPEDVADAMTLKEERIAAAQNKPAEGEEPPAEED